MVPPVPRSRTESWWATTVVAMGTAQILQPGLLFRGSPSLSFQAYWLLTSHNCTPQGCITALINAGQQRPSQNHYGGPSQLQGSLVHTSMVPASLLCFLFLCHSLQSHRCSPIHTLRTKLRLFPSSLS